ncbi:HesA/MoeB/ThiF family protein [Rhodohalobacter sulfatireducens]|uniref:HesA/MoeB/ThiF family protein n=1 Tax=Rhodohalobacter sulfatireducens TaxID=2911366 RepID=A0ABS9K8U5_9BACT|nr:HesA/MoeB/ThiF family protein [Rhodohalobacter sulfatireducens]MCG2587278.1 HesA/MoeB/ThiF family protein [Rhodohalobacter sulfatireducens]
MPKNGFTEKYSRQIKLPEVGSAGQEKLGNAKILIVGMGGLGCPAAQYLAAAGVGTLGLMDHDHVNLSNLHRQILYRESDVGKLKGEVAKTALRKLNPDVNLISIPERLDNNNALALFEKFDLIIDGSDNFQTKYLINDAAVLTDKPWIYASIYKYQGQLSVFNYESGPTYRCLFPTTTNQNVSCEEVGVIGVLPGVLGTLQATEAIKMILNAGSVISGKLKIIDLLTNQDQLIKLQKNAEQVEKVKSRGLKPEIIECELASADKLYLDVREPYEEPRPQNSNIISIPLNQLKARHHEIPKDRQVHVFCQHGIRSKNAIEYLSDNFGFTNLVNVEDGIQSILKEETHA